MRRYILYIVCVIAALGLGGCVAADENDILFRDGDVTLTLSLGDLTRNNTADNGVGEGTNDDDTSGIVLNENKIASLEIFLYANGAEGMNATYATRIEGSKVAIHNKVLLWLNILHAAVITCIKCCEV